MRKNGVYFDGSNTTNTWMSWSRKDLKDKMPFQKLLNFMNPGWPLPLSFQAEGGVCWHMFAVTSIIRFYTFKWKTAAWGNAVCSV